jgi:hypothetical protein
VTALPGSALLRAAAALCLENPQLRERMVELTLTERR